MRSQPRLAGRLALQEKRVTGLVMMMAAGAMGVTVGHLVVGRITHRRRFQVKGQIHSRERMIRIDRQCASVTFAAVSGDQRA